MCLIASLSFKSLYLHYTLQFLQFTTFSSSWCFGLYSAPTPVHGHRSPHIQSLLSCFHQDGQAAVRHMSLLHGAHQLQRAEKRPWYSGKRLTCQSSCFPLREIIICRMTEIACRHRVEGCRAQRSPSQPEDRKWNQHQICWGLCHLFWKADEQIILCTAGLVLISAATLHLLRRTITVAKQFDSWPEHVTRQIFKLYMTQVTEVLFTFQTTYHLQLGQFGFGKLQKKKFPL